MIFKMKKSVPDFIKISLKMQFVLCSQDLQEQADSQPAVQTDGRTPLDLLVVLWVFLSVTNISTNYLFLSIIKLKIL